MIKIICMTINHKPNLYNGDSHIVKKIQVRTLYCVYNTIESAEGACKRDWVINEPNRGLTWHQSQREAEWLMLTTLYMKRCPYKLI